MRIMKTVIPTTVWLPLIDDVVNQNIDTSSVRGPKMQDKVSYTVPLSNLIRLVLQQFLSTAQVRVVQLFCTQLNRPNN